jgi:hypothetical protein
MQPIYVAQVVQPGLPQQPLMPAQPQPVAAQHPAFVPSADDLDDDDLPPAASNHKAAEAAQPSASPAVARARFMLPLQNAANCRPGDTLFLQILGKWSHTMMIPAGYKPSRRAR